MPKDTIDEFFDEFNAELLKPEYQAELKEVITKSPEAYRKSLSNKRKAWNLLMMKVLLMPF